MVRRVSARRTAGAPRRASALAGVLLLAVVGAYAAPAHEAAAASLHFEIANANGVNPFSGYNYLCPDCTSAQYASMVLPAGYAKRNDRLLLPQSVGGFPATPPAGVAAALDFVTEIPGNDFFYCCEVLNGSVLGIDANAGVVFTTALVKRSNVFVYEAGDVLHELIDASGSRYALFLIDLALAGTHDPGTVGSLADLARPAGWTYESRVLGARLEVGVDAQGTADNIGQVALGVGVLAAWQRYEVPEPATGVLVAGGLSGLAAARRRRPALIAHTGCR